MANFAGKRVTVMGLGRFGGGSGVARWLVHQGAQVLITDSKPASELAEPLAEVDDLVSAGGLSLRLGEHLESDFAAADLVIANPAVSAPWANEYLLAAERAGVPINTEIGLFVERLPNRANTIGITGTVGKSTTTAMIAHALTHTHGDLAAGGNIGISLLDRLAPDAINPITQRTAVVLELSSFMLYWLGRAQHFSPRVAVVTNIAGNHLDWHGTIEHYAQCKRELLAYQHAGDCAILGPGTESWASMCELTGAQVQLSGGAESAAALTLPGRHNKVNAQQALMACMAYDSSLRPDELASAIAGFPGLDHRLQLVREHRGVRYFNDSKCTTPEACLTALEALTTHTGLGHVHLIAGGYDKHADLTPIMHQAKLLAGLYCIGQTGAGLAAAEAGAGHVELCKGLEPAVAAASARAKPGDVVLLSPGCASWDQFANYEFRGAVFIAVVEQLA